MKTNILAYLFIAFTALIVALPAQLSAEDLQPKSSTKKVLILGDSLTEGYGINKEQAFPALLQRKLKHADITNAGISGSTSASAYLRLKRHLKKHYDIVVLALGSNDGLRAIPTETTYKNLSKAIEFAQTKNVKILLLGARIPPNYGAKNEKAFAAIFTKLKNKYKVKLMPFLLEGVAGQKDLNQPDGIHPNEKGHKIMADNIEKYLKEFL